MKRNSRKMSQEQKEKISKALKGIKRDNSTRQKQSEAMKRYWANIPFEQNNEDKNSINGEREKE